MKLSILRLLFDFGLLVLIWMVQLIIYPSFQFYSENNLLPWHEKYVVAISFVVIPLMFGQLITAIFQLIHNRNWFSIVSMFLIVMVWVSTFTQFVPIHDAIASGETNKQLLEDLVFKNWIRTTIWTLIFIWTFINIFRQLSADTVAHNKI